MLTAAFKAVEFETKYWGPKSEFGPDGKRKRIKALRPLLRPRLRSRIPNYMDFMGYTKILEPYRKRNLLQHFWVNFQPAFWMRVGSGKWDYERMELTHFNLPKRPDVYPWHNWKMFVTPADDVEKAFNKSLIKEPLTEQQLQEIKKRKWINRMKKFWKLMAGGYIIKKKPHKSKRKYMHSLITTPLFG
jgi:hypothetical protein